MAYLQGGRKNTVARVGQSVHRPAGFWSPAVHNLLNHVRAQGFLGAPTPLGFDDQGNEVVSFLPGLVSNYPLSEDAKSLLALISAAQLLRNFHDATVSFLNAETVSLPWLLPPRSPMEVICHGDFAPYNVVLEGQKAVGIIDFDTAHPAPRVWDIAYALYRWAPFTNPFNDDGFGSLAEQIQRASHFCAQYGLSLSQRKLLPTLMIERLETLVNFMIAKAKAGNETFQENMADGHHLIYRADIDYLKHNRPAILAGLTNSLENTT